MSGNTSTQHVDNMRRSFFASFNLPEGSTITDFDELPETEQEGWKAAFACAFQYGFMSCKQQAMEKLESLGKGGKS